MAVFNDVKGADIIYGDYVGAATGTVTVSTFSWVGAINNNGDVITLDERNVEYYAVVSKSGISAFAANLTDALFGAVGASIATHLSGGVGVYRIVYIKFRNGKQSVLRCMDEYYKYIKKHCNARAFDPEMVNALEASAKQ